MTLKGDTRLSELDGSSAFPGDTRLYAIQDPGAGYQDRRLLRCALVELVGRQRLARFQSTQPTSAIVFQLPPGHRAYELVGSLRKVDQAGLFNPAVQLSADGASFRDQPDDYGYGFRYGRRDQNDNQDGYPGAFTSAPSTAIVLAFNLHPDTLSSLRLTVVGAGSAVRTAVLFRSSNRHAGGALRSADGAGYCLHEEVHTAFRLIDAGGDDLAVQEHDLTLYGLL